MIEDILHIIVSLLHNLNVFKLCTNVQVMLLVERNGGLHAMVHLIFKIVLFQNFLQNLVSNSMEELVFFSLIALVRVLVNDKSNEHDSILL